jgi:geranylgeranyl diphosphate synthase type 3
MLIYQNMKYLFLTEAGEYIMCEVAPLQLLSDNKVDFTRLAGILGQYFQIRDDYCNLCMEQVTSELSALHG